MATDGTLDENVQEDAANLIALAESPINLNTASENELKQLFFLSERQIKNIINRRNLVGAFATIHELQTIRGLRKTDIQRLEPFIIIEPIEQEERNKSLTNTFVARIQRAWPKAKGYYAKNDTTAAPFVGSPYKILIRDEVTYAKQWRAGFVAEKDPGEPVFAHGITATDFTSAFAQYTNSETVIRKAVVGHYTIQYGQGLGLWTGFSRDASTVQTSICRMANSFNGTLSASESGYMRGVAVKLGKGIHNLDLFASHTDGDVSTTEDSDSIKLAQTIQTDGYHRTLNEISGRHNIEQITYGGYLDLSFRRVRAGIGGNHWHSSLPLARSTDLYKRFYPTGKNLTTLHADYKWFATSMLVYGEVAWQSSNTIAATQGIDIALGGGNTFSLAYRHFGKKYYVVNQNPYSKAGKPGGENGIYAALALAPIKHLTLLANVNIFNNAWLTYQKPAPTKGYKSRITATYTINRNNTLTLRFRYDEYDDKAPESRNEIAKTRRNALRFQWTGSPTANLKLRSSAERVRYAQEGCASSVGFWIGQEVTYTIDNPKIGISAIVGHFDTDTYDSRIYPTISDVPYSMTLTSLAGNGIIAAGKISWRIVKGIDAWLWCNHTKYYDRDKISSGTSQIDATHKFEAKAQIRIKLSKFFANR